MGKLHVREMMNFVCFHDLGEKPVSWYNVRRPD